MNNREVSRYLSIVTLNVNGLSYPIKRYRMMNGLKKIRSDCSLSTRNSLHWQRHTD
jgi:hypothetical protein